MTYPPGSFIERDMIAHSVCTKCSLLEICFLKTVFKKVAPDMDNCRIKLVQERYTWLLINLFFKSRSFFWQCALCTLSDCVCWVHTFRARISKLFSSPRIDSKESILLAYVAWQAGTTTPTSTRFLTPTDCFKIPALNSQKFVQRAREWVEEAVRKKQKANWLYYLHDSS